MILRSLRSVLVWIIGGKSNSKITFSFVVVRNEKGAFNGPFFNAFEYYLATQFTTSVVSVIRDTMSVQDLLNECKQILYSATAKLLA